MRGIGLGFGGLFFFAFFTLGVGGVIVWILAILEVARTPEPQFRRAGTDKLTWVLVVALTGFVGALIWYVAERAKVIDAGRSGPPPAGWYPEPGTGTLRWWDGSGWTEYRQG